MAPFHGNLPARSRPRKDESIAAFVRRKFGAELLDRLVAPFVSGVYAGDPERLSLRAAFPKLHEFETQYGSVLRGAMKSRPPRGTPKSCLCSFRAGMDTLPNALAAALGEAYRGSATVVGFRRADKQKNSGFTVNIVSNGEITTLTAGAVVVATPTNAAAKILRGISGQFEDIVSRIEYAPVAVVSAGYPAGQVRRAGNGFGFLVPRSEGLRVLGTVWNSSLFPTCAPAGMALFTSFAGGCNGSRDLWAQRK